MIKKYRDLFNDDFSFDKYKDVISDLKEKSGIEPQFRVSESPIFLTKDFKDKLKDACESISTQIKDIPQEELFKAVPANCNVPNDTKQPHFFTIDFGICESKTGEIEPQLIELQAFPTLYTFQKELENTLCDVYPFLNYLNSNVFNQDNNP